MDNTTCDPRFLVVDEQDTVGADTNIDNDTNDDGAETRKTQRIAAFLAKQIRHTQAKLEQTKKQLLRGGAFSKHQASEATKYTDNNTIGTSKTAIWERYVQSRDVAILRRLQQRVLITVSTRLIMPRIHNIYFQYQHTKHPATAQ